jgi:hypothetical protein
MINRRLADAPHAGIACIGQALQDSAVIASPWSKTVFD